MIFQIFQKIFIFFLVFSLFIGEVLANVRISSLLANPTTNVRDEFIEIQNPHCEAISLENYKLTNSKQEYIFGEKILEKHEKLILTRVETGISLRDAGDTITLYGAENELIDEIIYTAHDARKGNVLILDIENENCDETHNAGGNEEDWIHENTETEGKNDENNSESEENSHTEDNAEKTDASENPDEEKFIFPEEWEFFDRDGDGFYDEMLIIFPEILTGSIDINVFSFVRIDGENREKIQDNTVLSGSILENSITLSLEAFLNDENVWKFEDEKFSGIFLIWDEGNEIFAWDSERGIKIDEKSFENYTKITKNLHQNEEENTDENTEEISNTAENAENIFPEIRPILQRSTTAELEDLRFFCDENPCKININFDNIFDKNFSKSDFSCEIILDDKKYSTCNPSQMTISQDSAIIFHLTHIKTTQEKFTTFFVDFSRVKEQDKEKIQSEENVKNEEKNSKNISKTENTAKKQTKNNTKKSANETELPVIKIHSDGKIDEIYEWADDEKIVCFVSKCMVNLNASETENPDDLRLKFFWKFADITESNRKNPTAVSFNSGEYEIILTVTDEYDRVVQKKISVFVPTKEEISQEKFIKNSENIEKNLQENVENFEEKIFEIPEFVLQNPLNFTIESDKKYICYTKTTTCSINLSLSETEKNLLYSWIWDDEAPIMSQNPRSKSLEIGKNILVLNIFEKDNPENILATKILTVEVIKTTSQRQKAAKNNVSKPKKTTKKSEKTIEESDKDAEINPLPEENINIETEYNSLPLSMAGILFSSVVLAKIRQNRREETAEGAK